jgi:hypothetical protein
MWGLELLMSTLRVKSLTIAPPPRKVIFLDNIFVINMILEQHIVINFHEFFFNMHIILNELECFYTTYINR